MAPTSKRRSEKDKDKEKQAKERNKALSKMLKQREANLAKLLQRSCKNPSNCLALGHYGDLIKLHFDGFQKLDHLDKSKMKRIGSDSNNGFIIQLAFKKNRYRAFAALKSVMQDHSDNLLYEYLVGKLFINHQIKKFPVFLETYDLFEYNDMTAYNQVVNAVQNKSLHQIQLASMIKHNNIDFKKINSIDAYRILASASCLKHKRLCITIQHFDNLKSIYEKSHDPAFKCDMSSMLFQVYFALNQLRNQYTHYDLHSDNIMVYKPFPGKQCMLMRYHIQGQVYEFKSEYVPKIIDYGRNYFNNGRVNSKMIIEQVCKSKACLPECGINRGYGTIHGSQNGFDVSKYYWIDPTKRNVSHDLRAAFDLIRYHSSFHLPPRKIAMAHPFGTPEVLQGPPNQINNVTDMFEYLKSYVHPIQQYFGSKKYDHEWKTVAVMDVYDDGRDYEFTLLPDSLSSAIPPKLPSAPVKDTLVLVPASPKSLSPKSRTASPKSLSPRSRTASPKSRTASPKNARPNTPKPKTKTRKVVSQCQGQNPCLEENGCMMTKPGKVRAYCRKKPVTKTVKKKRKTPAKRTQKAP